MTVKSTLQQQLQALSVARYPLHMPGHKRRVRPAPGLDCYAWDLTEIDGADDLHDADGILADAMARKGAQVLGIDLATKSLKEAQLHALEAQTPQINYREISAEALAAEQPASFDVVTCMEMLEHVPNPQSIVAACAALVKPGGWVYFSTINRNAKAYMFAIVGAEYVLKMLPRGTHDFAKFITPSELLGFARKQSLDVQAMRGLEYNPLSKRYKLSADTSVNYLVATQKAV